MTQDKGPDHDQYNLPTSRYKPTTTKEVGEFHRLFQTDVSVMMSGLWIQKTMTMLGWVFRIAWKCWYADIRTAEDILGSDVIQ